MKPRKVLQRFASPRVSCGGSSRALRFGVTLTAVISALVISALAEGSAATMDTIVTLTTTQLTSVQQAVLSVIQSIVPVAIVVFGSIFVVTIGKRIFCRFAS